MTRWPHFKIIVGALAATLLLLTLPHRAAADDDDPPGRVARLHSIEGSVSVQPAGSDDWGEAQPNRPITTGDKLWSDQNSRVELGLGSAHIRLGANTAFTFLNLTDQTAQISVNEGTLDVHLRSLGDQETFEIDTPNLAFTLLRPGDYRVGVNENGDTTIVTVRNGTGEVTGGGQAFTLSPNSTGTFVGTDQLTPDIGPAVPPDDFDAWCIDLNGREDRAPRFVPPDMVGAEDLDANGNWQSVPDYGNVWVPNGVVAGWQPYQYGRWVWVSPWGWTWVDDAPWGFAPFHYGRWVFVNGYWGWTPGPAFVVGAPRPVYSPALVAWVGGPGAGLAIGVGVGVAWFPLGPREVYVPPYAVSRTYVTNINVTNTVVDRTTVINVYNNVTVNHVTNITYVNRSYVTATSQNSFTSGQPINRNVVKVDPAVIAHAQVGTAVGAGVAPQAHSEFAGRVATNVPHPPAAVASRPIVAKTAPPPPPPSFAAQQKAIAANGGKPLAPAQINAIRPASTSAAAKSQVRIAPPAKPAPATSTSGNRGNAPAANPPAANRPAPSTSSASPGNRSDRPPSAQPKPATNPPPAENSGSRPPSQPSTTKPPVVTNDNIKPAPKPAAAQPTENKPQPAENKPATKPPAAKPTESKPQPAESKPAENKPAENKPAENKPPASQPKSNTADKPPKKTDKKPPPKDEKPDKDKN